MHYLTDATSGEHFSCDAADPSHTNHGDRECADFLSKKKVIKMKDKRLLSMLNYCFFFFNRNDSNIATLHVGIEKHYIYKTKDRNYRVTGFNHSLLYLNLINIGY